MQPNDIRRHRLTLRLPQSLKEDTLQAKLGHALIGLDSRGHLKQAVGLAHVAHTRRVAAAHDDAVVGLLDDFEVVGDQGAFGVVRGAQFGGAPEVGGCFGGLVFAGLKGALGGVSCLSLASIYTQECMLYVYPSWDLETEHTPTTENPRTKCLHQPALLLQQRRINLTQRHTAHTQIVHGRVTRWIQLAEGLPGEDRVRRGVNWDEAAVAGGVKERAQGGGCPDGGELEGFAEDAHFELILGWCRDGVRWDGCKYGWSCRPRRGFWVGGWVEAEWSASDVGPDQSTCICGLDADMDNG